MIRWQIVCSDWETPLKRPAGSGKAADAKAACAAVENWLAIHMRRFAGSAFWRFIELEGNTKVVDFGSHVFFARFEEVEA